MWVISQKVNLISPHVSDITEGKSDINTCEWYHRKFSLLWNHTTVWFQFSLLWNHTPDLKSPWITLNQTEITLKSDLMIQGLNPCIKRKSHRKLVWFFWITEINALVGVISWINPRSTHFTSFHLDSWNHTSQLVDISDSGNITLVYQCDFQWN